VIGGEERDCALDQAQAQRGCPRRLEIDDTSQLTAIELEARGAPRLGRVTREGVEILRGGRAFGTHGAEDPLEPHTQLPKTPKLRAPREAGQRPRLGTRDQPGRLGEPSRLGEGRQIVARLGGGPVVNGVDEVECGIAANELKDMGIHDDRM